MEWSDIRVLGGKKIYQQITMIMTSLIGVPLSLVLFLFLCFGLSCYGVEGRSIISMEDRERQPLIPNKTVSLKNSQPRDIDAYDCVDINKQPAFDHPLLKNHKIQMVPSFASKLIEIIDSNIHKISGIGLQTKGCPPGSVPIQRCQPHLVNIHPLTAEHLGQHYATLDTTGSATYYGARAIISLVNPPVKMYQYSMAQIWIQSGPEAELNNIQVGWAVHPKIYGDNLTRLTAFWTADGYKKTGCYNVICPGFVQVDSHITLGLDYDKTSVFLGDEYITDLAVIQDKPTGNWWLIFNKTTKVGYWPKEIFTHLASGASFVRYGGSTFNSPDGLSPPMGFGHFPDNHYREAGFFSQMQIVKDAEKMTLVDVQGSKMKRYVDVESCYNLMNWYYQGKRLRQTISYGGPGGECGP